MTFKLVDKLGYVSPFQNKENEFYEGGILFQELVDEIKQYNHFYFDYRKYVSKTPETHTITQDAVSVPTGRFEDEPLYIYTVPCPPYS